MLHRSITWGFLVSLALLAGCTAYPERSVKTFTNATGGESLERAFWTDVQKQDWKDLQAHLAGNFVYITSAGRLDRTQAMQELQQLQIGDYSLGDLSTEMNRDTFVVSYTITLRGTTKGQALGAQPQRRVTVWQQQKSGWVAIAHSVMGSDNR